MATAILATPRVLIYSATAGYRHDSIPTAIAALKQLGQDNNIAFDATEDRGQFSDENLTNYDGLLFLSNSEEVLDDDGKQAFQNYLNKGGNYIGIHSASACLFSTTFYQKQVGALFDYHPELQPVVGHWAPRLLLAGTDVIAGYGQTFVVVDRDHPSTKTLPDRWTYTEEAYNFRSDPRVVGAHVVLSVDDSSYTDTGVRNYSQGSPHPIAWYQERGAGADDPSLAGRSYYTSLGHLSSTWEDENFLAHVLGGIQWALASNTTRATNPDGQVGARSEGANESTSSDTASTSAGGAASNGARSSTVSTGIALAAVPASIVSVLWQS